MQGAKCFPAVTLNCLRHCTAYFFRTGAEACFLFCGKKEKERVLFVMVKCCSGAGLVMQIVPIQLIYWEYLNTCIPEYSLMWLRVKK